MENFDRKYEFLAGVPTRPGVIIKDLRLIFNIEKSATTSPSNSQIMIYNLSPKSLSTINLPDCVVQLRAGYGANTPVISSGNITFAVTKGESTEADVCTQIEYVENRAILRDTYVSLSYSGTINRERIVRNIADQMGVNLAISPKVTFGDYRMGFSFIGLASTALKKVCAVDNIRWSMQNENLQLVVANQPFSEKRIYEISPRKGLIGTPEAFILSAKESNIQDKNTTVSKSQKGWRVNYLLNPYIGINDYVYISSSAVTGYFWVYKLNMIGDSHGDDWRCEAEVFEPGVNVTALGEGYAE
jgi:hypothetical protein